MDLLSQQLQSFSSQIDVKIIRYERFLNPLQTCIKLFQYIQNNSRINSLEQSNNIAKVSYYC